jgi:hypothetical protein
MKTLIQNLSLALGLLTLPTLVQAQFSFTTNNGAITITGYNTAAGLNMVIPAATNGLPVTGIANFAFFANGITNVVIPNSITNIGIFAFDNCINLTSVTIPNSITSLAEAVFDNCSGLTNITIPNSVTNIGDFAFTACSSLTSVTIGTGVTSIGEAVFEECFSLTSVPIPNNVTSLGLEAFHDCSSLTNMTIPNSVTSIGDFAFAECASLTNITVVATNPAYSSLGGVLFDKAKATLIQFPGGLGGGYVITNSVTSIEVGAFDGCPSLLNVTIPNSVTSIGNQGFADCSSLTNVTLPDSVTNIGDFAFEFCGLTSVTIPNSVSSIGFDAFVGCSNLTSVTIPNSVTSIEDDTFADCTSLTNVTIPNSVTNLGFNVFANCTSLKSAYFQGNAPPDNGTVFSGFPVNDPVTVYYLSRANGWGPTFSGVPTALWNPQANTLSFTGGHFGFNLTGPTNVVIIVEACTNLSHPVWLPVATNTFSGNGTSTFSDLQSGAHPIRFYRERSP